jgi:hypothetical protein
VPELRQATAKSTSEGLRGLHGSGLELKPRTTRKMERMNESVTLNITKDEALILFELLVDWELRENEARTRLVIPAGMIGRMTEHLDVAFYDGQD